MVVITKMVKWLIVLDDKSIAWFNHNTIKDLSY
jgi:hypothetical protein